MAGIRMSDRVFLALESARTPQHVAYLAVFALPPGVDPAARLDHVFQGLAAAPVVTPFTFRPRHARRPAVDRTWEVLPPERVDRSRHVRRHTLTRPGERELLALVSRLHAVPLDPTRPLWECHLVEGQADDRFALYFKVHHALVDGLGFEQRLRRTVAAGPEAMEVCPPWSVDIGAGGTDSPAGTAAPVGKADRAEAAGRVVRSIARGLVAPRDPARAVPFLVPRSPLNGAVTAERHILVRSYGFDRFRAVARAAGVTVNDVLLSVCGGALRQSLAAAGALPGRPLTAATPVSTRRAGDMSTANAFALTVMSMGTDVADPLERLRTVARSGELAKRELDELPKGTTGLYGALFTWPFVAQNVLGAGGATRPPYNVVVSNLPGSTPPGHLAGCTLEAVFPLGSVCHGVRLFIAARSSSGRFDLCWVGDRAVGDLLEAAADHLGDEITLLERAVGVRDSAADTPTVPSAATLRPAPSQQTEG